jgi:translation initiation factor IF-3
MPKPYSGGRNRYDRGNYVRKNERIRAREVRLIGSDGKQIGVVSRDDALQAAKQVGLDLVEISANARPPVCRILDFGKYMYEESKRQKENKAKANSSSKIKEVKFRVRTEEHDYLTKLRHGEEFLYKGNKLKLSLMFRGRENEHKELGVEVLAKAGTDLNHVGSADGEPKLSGRHVNMIMTPLPAAKRKLKYNESLGKAEE